MMKMCMFLNVTVKMRNLKYPNVVGFKSERLSFYHSFVAEGRFLGSLTQFQRPPSGTPQTSSTLYVNLTRLYLKREHPC